jgi:hypothetical protein
MFLSYSRLLFRERFYCISDVPVLCFSIFVQAYLMQAVVAQIHWLSEDHRAATSLLVAGVVCPLSDD